MLSCRLQNMHKQRLFLVLHFEYEIRHDQEYLRLPNRTDEYFKTRLRQLLIWHLLRCQSAAMFEMREELRRLQWTYYMHPV